MKERIIIVPAVDNTRKIIEMYASSMIRAGVELAEVAEALHTALVKIFGEAADQFEALNAALNALAVGQSLEPLKPGGGHPPPHTYPCPAAGHKRRPENVRIPQMIRRAQIQPRARSTIKQRRNRRRE